MSLFYLSFFSVEVYYLYITTCMHAISTHLALSFLCIPRDSVKPRLPRKATQKATQKATDDIAALLILTPPTLIKR